MKKGDKGGFEFDFSCRHRFAFLNELLGHHTRSSKFETNSNDQKVIDSKTETSFIRIGSDARGLRFEVSDFDIRKIVKFAEETEVYVPGNHTLQSQNYRASKFGGQL